jgi:predicted CxxxxCH...CXXCH cytochrome family protein
MSMKKIFLIYSLVFVSFVVFLYGCSEVKNNLTVAPGTQTHSTGWADPSSPNFHGTYLYSTYYDLNTCKSCHGGDYSGGTSGVSCLTCHQSGPQSCNTCHGNSEHINPPKSLLGGLLNTDIGVGAHEQHLNSDTTQRISAIVDCNECHTQVMSFDDTNHISKDNQNVARLVFGTLARTVTEGVTPDPQWSKSTQTCSNTYCHGTFKNGNQSAAPVFNNPGSVFCGTCHGNPQTGNPLPGGTHTSIYPNLNQCYLCHGGVMNQNGTFKDKSRHVNGIVDIGAK